MTEVREAPRELLAYALAMRDDWDRDLTWNALLACKAANWPWKRIHEEMSRLLFVDDSSPEELRHAAGGTRLPRTGRELTLEEREELRSAALARCEKATERFAGRRHDGPGGDP